MIKYLGEMEEEDLIMFVLEHLKDHKGPQKLIEGLEPVRLLVPSILNNVLISHPSYRSWKRKRQNLLSMYGGRSFSKVWLTTKDYLRTRCLSTNPAHETRVVVMRMVYFTLLYQGAQVRYTALAFVLLRSVLAFCEYLP